MTQPELLDGFSLSMVLPVLLAGLAAWLFWDRVVPRQLRGLQVAFQTGKKQYEVHQVTNTVEDAKELLSSRGMRFGVVSYLTGLTGCMILLFEFLNYRYLGSGGFHSPTIALALIMIMLPALVSAGTSLGAQVVRPLGTTRATMQLNTSIRNASFIALTIAWFALAAVVGYVMDAQGYGRAHALSIASLVAFSPAVLAYGRILGSSWYALKQSSSTIAKGEASPFHNHRPNARQQFIAQVVNINLVAMPFVAFNTLLSLIVLLYDPTMFEHSARVKGLDEYRLQNTYMEEGGLLGFGLIELFSFIPQDDIRVPIVTALLLFLLLNVAVIGFLFVYEVARILFLDVQDVAGVGGIRLADSRLLRAEPTQQARVLNFCFTGFAGQSMLLLALAMITFWDSSFLPQADSCGTWETTVCTYMEKDMLEELTWMLASGGQIAFFVVWSLSWKKAGALGDISFDAAMGENRARLRGVSDMIYVKQRTTNELISVDDWATALNRYEAMSEASEDILVGLDMARKMSASMILHAGLGRWDEAEDAAINLLALQGGRDTKLAHKILFAASLCQRDNREVKSRLHLLDDDDVESVRLKWVASLLNPKRSFNEQLKSILSIDPPTLRNIDMLRRYSVGEVSTPRIELKTPIEKRAFLSEIAKMRLVGKSEYALSLLEDALEADDDETWVQAYITQSLLHHDAGRIITAVDLLEKLSKKHSPNPHINNLLQQFALQGHTRMPSSETTGIEWLFGDVEWELKWEKHNVAPAPFLERVSLKSHAWKANGWVALGIDEPWDSLKRHKKGFHQSLPNELPMGLYTHLAGILVTVGGMPIDIGLPGGFNSDSAEASGLMDLGSNPSS